MADGPAGPQRGAAVALGLVLVAFVVNAKFVIPPADEGTAVRALVVLLVLLVVRRFAGRYGKDSDDEEE